MRSLEGVLERLQGVKETAEGHTALCPAHQDRRQSLSITHRGGKVLLHCHAGCSLESVLQAIGLNVSDLFDAPRRKQRGTKTKVAEYSYTDADGRLLYQVVRFQPKDFRHRHLIGNAWKWDMKGVSKVLYRLPQVKQAIAEGQPVFVVEGEKDVHSLESIGLAGTCNAGGAGKWQKSYSETLAGASAILLPDNDEPGRKHSEDAARSLHGTAQSVRMVNLPGLPPKGDVSDWIAAGGTKEELLSQVDAAGDWKPEADDDSETAFPHTEAGNAELFIYRHGKDLRYAKHTGKWLIWTGQRWHPDADGHVTRLALKTVRSRYDELKHCASDDERNRLFSFLKSSESSYKLRALLDIAKDLEGVTVQADALDADPWLMNVQNGTLDLRSGKLQAHRREDLLTKQVPIAYDPSAECPRWTQFLCEVFDRDGEVIGFAHKALGYSLTGDTSEQCFFILHGCGSNGKSVFLRIAQAVSGDYSTGTHTDTLMEKRGETVPNDLARLKGSRLVTASETTAGRRLAEGLLKQATGQDALTARFLHQEFFDFSPEFKLWLACNHLPRVDGQDHGMWRRIKLIPFTVIFRDADSPEGPYKDPKLITKLEEELPGILRWAVEGCSLWQDRGLGTPAAVSAATGSYQADMDILGGFLSDSCVFMPQAFVSAKDLYAAYLKWCESNNEKAESQRTFGLRLGERGTCQKKRGGGGRVFWHGIGLVTGDSEGETDHMADESLPAEVDRHG